MYSVCCINSEKPFDSEETLSAAAAAVRDFIIIFSEQCSAAAAAPVTALLSPVKYDHTSREQERAI